MSRVPEVEDVNGDNRVHPWELPGRNLSLEEQEEVSMFLANPRFDQEDRARKDALEEDIQKRQKDLEEEINRKRLVFKEDIKKRRDDFKEQEIEWQRRRAYPLENEIRNYSIEGARDRAVPAYTFTKFKGLPVEIKLKIWSIAAAQSRSRSPQLHRIAYQMDGVSVSVSHRKQCVRLLQLTSILFACRDSRSAAESIYIRLPCTTPMYKERHECYFDIMQDTFCIFGRYLDGFKILIDLMVKANTNRPLELEVQQNMEKFQNIRNLAVDFYLFTQVPAYVWLMFLKLERLTICFHSFHNVSNHEIKHGTYQRDCGPQLTIPEPKTKHGKRASWILQNVSQSLESVVNQNAVYKMPKINVILKGERTISDWTAKGWQTELLGDRGDVYKEDRDDEIDERNTGEESSDSAWFKDAAHRMGYRIPFDHLKDMVEHYHPDGADAFSPPANLAAWCWPRVNLTSIIPILTQGDREDSAKI